MSDAPQDKVLRYKAEPTINEFHADDSFVRGIKGPVGSGKSVGCVMEIFSRSLRQKPSPDGVRRSRWAIIRNTYPELKATTIKTWQDWIPDERFPVVYDSPIRCNVRDRLGDDTTLDLEVLFLSLDKPKDVRKLLSLELTGAWINEAREVVRAILDGVTQRVGRYPSKRNGGPTWSGVILDTNPPDDEHWWHDLAEIKQPEGYRFWDQPGALVYSPSTESYRRNPRAENVRNQPLGYQYWERMLEGKDREWIKVYILGQYGIVMEGKPVYPEYSDDVHCVPASQIEVMRGLPLRLGWDFGLTPAVAIGQVTPDGRLQVIDELVSDSMGIRQFAQQIVKPYLANTYPGMSIAAHADPAGTQRAQTDESTCLEELAAAGLRAEPANSNSFVARREAVAGFLTRMDRTGKPGFIISDKCKTLRKGFNGHYQFKLVQGTSEKYREVPDKNRFSHVHDGLQYLALMVDQVWGGTQERHKAREVVTPSSQGWAA